MINTHHAQLCRCIKVRVSAAVYHVQIIFVVENSAASELFSSEEVDLDDVDTGTGAAESLQ